MPDMKTSFDDPPLCILRLPSAPKLTWRGVHGCKWPSPSKGFSQLANNSVFAQKYCAPWSKACVSPRRVDILPDKPRDLSNKEISKCCPRPSAHAKPDIPVPTIANFGLFDSILMPTNLQLCFSSSEFK
jgi:hypothetical protein